MGEWVIKNADKTTDFNETVQNLSQMDSDSTLQLIFKNLPLVKFGYSIKKYHY